MQLLEQKQNINVCKHECKCESVPVDQAAPSPHPSAELKRVSPSNAGSRLSASCKFRSPPSRNGEPLLAVPVSRAALTPEALGRRALLTRLRERIRAIERHDAPLAPLPPAGPASDADGWTLGAPEIDALLGATALDPAGVHEVKPAAKGAGGRAAALIFALRLAVRRMRQMPAARGRRLLWCWPSSLARELGRLYGPGLASLGLDPEALLIVETAKAADTLWALEEGLNSGSLALVLGVLDEVALTPARRLSLAAEAHLVPCLLLTGAHAPATAATATRWLLAPARSGAHLFEAPAPGAPRLAVTLERCRGRRAAPPEASLTLEWSDETHRFRVAPLLAHRADGAPHAGCRAGG